MDVRNRGNILKGVKDYFFFESSREKTNLCDDSHSEGERASLQLLNFLDCDAIVFHELLIIESNFFFTIPNSLQSYIKSNISGSKERIASKNWHLNLESPPFAKRSIFFVIVIRGENRGMDQWFNLAHAVLRLSPNKSSFLCQFCLSVMYSTFCFSPWRSAYVFSHLRHGPKWFALRVRIYLKFRMIV